MQNNNSINFIEPVDISSDSTITPTERKPIEKVDACSWQEVSLTQLHDQLTTLQSRYYSALDMHKYEMAEAILKGIEQLKQRISDAGSQQTDKIGI